MSSSSKARKILLDRFKINYEIFLPNVNETQLKNERPEILVKRLSLMKANQAKLRYKKSFIIAADTVVYARKRFFFKTEDVNVAFNNIKLLSGGRHTIYTGLTFISPKEEIKFYLSKTRIKFKKLNEEAIKQYLALEEWKNVAGSYAVQGFGSSFINFISGSYTSAIGLPIEKVYTIFRNHKIL